MFKFIFGFTLTSALIPEDRSLKMIVRADLPQMEVNRWKLIALQPLLQLFQRTPFCFRHHAPYKNQLHHHHGCEK